jgi:hypothetical protein
MIRFQKAQQDLERDGFEARSWAIGSLLSIQYAIYNVQETHAVAMIEFDRYFDTFRRQYSDEYGVLLLATNLNPSTKFQIGRTYSEPVFAAMSSCLAELIHTENGVERAGMQDTRDQTDPGSDDFSTDGLFR